MGWTAPYGISCARMRLYKSQTREPSVDQIIRIGMDTSKHIFQLHGVDSAERPVLRRKLRRNQVLVFFAELPPTVVGMEACGAGHYWTRELRKLGHEVKLMAPQHVKAYVKRNKNDGRDAEGWRIRVDGGIERSVPRAGSVTVDSLREGSHLVELTGVARGCRVEGANPRQVLVSGAGAASVAFDVVCTG